MHRLFLYTGLALAFLNCNTKKVEKSSLDPKIQSQLDSLKNTASLTTKNVIKNNMLITRVYHDADGSWQFFDELSTNSNTNVMIVGFGEIVKRDSSIIKLIGMPASHVAHRKSKDDIWKIELYKEPEE